MPGDEGNCLYTHECLTPVALAYSKGYEDKKSSLFQRVFCILVFFGSKTDFAETGPVSKTGPVCLTAGSPPSALVPVKGMMA